MSATTIYSAWQRQDDIRVLRLRVLREAATLTAARLSPDALPGAESPGISAAEAALDRACTALATAISRPAQCGQCSQSLPEAP